MYALLLMVLALYGPALVIGALSLPKQAPRARWSVAVVGADGISRDVATFITSQAAHTFRKGLDRPSHAYPIN